MYDYVGVFVSIILKLFINTSGFNLETRLPLVKQGHNGSYFGYSVAAHQIRNETTHRVNAGVLLVGAPLDQNLQPGTNRSGALWECPLTNEPGDCVQVITDGRRENATEKYYDKHIEANDLRPPSFREVKDGQWLGVTVTSQGPGKKVMVCAHRYVSDTYWCRGLCYILKQDLSFEKVREPCKDLSIKRGHIDYGMCSTGTGGVIFEDDNVVIGSPGSLNWRGSFSVFNIGEDFFNTDTNIYTIPLPDAMPNTLKKDSYLGMSVTAGYFKGDNTFIVVAGAPRGNETGQVMLFAKETQRGTNELVWKEYLIINGEQIASNFGYQVATADVNGDKLPDLIVAAPFYFNVENGEGGAVYVYMNDPVDHLINSNRTKLTGKLESRFGIALTSLGDLNEDEYDDIAVGAPYEGNGVVYIYLGSPTGIITKPSQIIKAEIIDPKYSITTFGYSLSGGVDLDENGYPDLLIGAYEKDAVILLRARPIIGFTTLVQPLYNLTNIDPNARNCLINNTNYIPCFSFQTCCKIDSLVKTYKNRELLINYTLEAETFERKTSRIWFDNFYTKNHIITKNLRISNSSLEFCESHTAYLKENTVDIQSPIKIRMSYKLIHKDPEPVTGRDLPPLDNYPILNQQQADRIFEATFLKDCGSDNICNSKLVVSADLLLEHLAPEPNQYRLVLGERKNLLMNVSVHNVGESAYQTQLHVLFPKQVNFNKVSSLTDTQLICHSSSDTHRICMLGNPLKQNKRANLQLEFDLGSVDGSEPSLEFEVIVNTTSIDLNSNNNNPLKLRVVVVEKTMLSITGTSVPEEIPEMLNIELKGESAIRYKEQVGSKVTHHYSIFNNGTWNVANLQVEIEWPFQVANDKEQGKWLLYIDEYPRIDGGTGKCDISANDVNPLKLRDGQPEQLVANYTLNDIRPSPGDKSDFPEKIDSSSNAKYNRVKRDTEMVVRAETYTGKDGKKYRIVKMNCLLNSAKCLKFSCYLDLIESKQYTSIIIKSRLWDATLIEDYADIDQIKIASRAKMHIPSSPVTLQNLYSDEFQVETNARVNIRGQQSTPPIPILFIIFAIVIGLLLFILLTLLLWKLGFFKRRRPDPTLSGNLEKHRLDDS